MICKMIRKMRRVQIWGWFCYIDPWCEPLLVPTRLPGGSAADIGVKPCDSRVADIHLRGHLIARFTLLEQNKDISLCSTRHIGVRCNCTEGVPYMVGGQVT